MDCLPRAISPQTASAIFSAAFWRHSQFPRQNFASICVRIETPGGAPMSHESPAFKRISRAPEKADDFATTEPWRVQAGEPEFPVLLKDPPHSARWQSVHGIGSREIAQRR